MPVKPRPLPYQISSSRLREATNRHHKSGPLRCDIVTLCPPPMTSTLNFDRRVRRCLHVSDTRNALLRFTPAFPLPVSERGGAALITFEAGSMTKLSARLHHMIDASGPSRLTQLALIEREGGEQTAMRQE